MANVYTSIVGTGDMKDFSAFALRCARGVDAMIAMRDDPDDAALPQKIEPIDAALPEKIEPSDRYSKAVITAQEQLAKARAITIAEADAAAAKMYQEQLTSRTEQLASRTEQLAKQATARLNYEAMLAHVVKWTPPTAEHDKLRTFMIAQLEDSILSDCDIHKQDEIAEVKSLTGEAWLAAEIARAERVLLYCERSVVEEINRAAASTAWLNQLRESL